MSDSEEKVGDEGKTVGEPDLPQLTKEEKKALFTEYEDMQRRLEALESEMKGVREKMSAHVKTMITRLKKHGPYFYNGREYVASRRNETWFFRVRAQNEGVEVID